MCSKENLDSQLADDKCVGVPGSELDRSACMA